MKPDIFARTFVCIFALSVLAARTSAGSRDLDAIVVTVNGTPIRERQVLAEVDERINVYAAGTATKGLIYDESSREQTRDFMRDDVLRVLIDRVLTGEQLAADGIEITDADVDAFFLAKVKERNQTIAEAKQEIADQGKTMPKVRERIRWNILAVEKLYDRHDPRKRRFTELEAQLEYRTNLDAYRQEEERRVSRILIAANPDRDAAFQRRARERAQALLAQAKAGENFGALARQYSEDELTKPRGGDRGWSPRGHVTAPGNDPFGDAAFALQKVGDLSDVVASVEGYDIVKLTGLRPARQKTFDEVKREIVARKNYMFIGAFWDSFTAQMRQKARIVWSPVELARRERKEKENREFLAAQGNKTDGQAPSPREAGR